MSDNKVTLDQLDNSAVEAMSSSVGDVSMLNTENKTIVGALAEIVGKKEIANAIGEPLAETDKFTEMSSEINGLLSTFKTNMMNAGVVVESGDKFKALIDKIKGLTEGEGNKGIQFASGVTMTSSDKKLFVNVEDSTESSYGCIDIRDLTFTPQIIIASIKQDLSGYKGYAIYSAFSAYPNRVYSFVNSGSATAGAIKYCVKSSSCNIDETGFSLPFNISGSPVECYWAAAGVGEEDTTLRDSLADILENKGVDVTEEDDIASLITKVDTISGGLDIISAAELPTTGKPNQMCIINENSGSFLVTSNNNDKNPDGFKVLLGSADNYPLIPITIDNVIENYRIRKVFYGSTQLDSYYWDNNEWTRVSAAKLMVYDNGSFPNEDIIGVLPSNTYVNQTSERIECRTDPRGDWSDGFISFTKPVDFNVYNTITFQAKSSADSHPLDFGLSTEPVNIYSTGTPSGCVRKVSSKSVNTSNSKYTVDISSFSGIGYLTIIIPSVQRFSYYYIYSIELS